TGRQPFAGESPIQVAFQHVNGRVPAPSNLVPWLPKEVDELVAALTARELDERPEDAAAALALVRRCVAGLDEGTLARRADVPAPSGTTWHATGATTRTAAAHGTADDGAVTTATAVRASNGTIALPIGAIS